MQSAPVVALGVLSLVCSAQAALFACPNPSPFADIIASTGEADDIFASYSGKTMKMIAWDSVEEEKTNNCYSITFDDAAKNFTIDFQYEDGTMGQVTGIYNLVKTFPAYLEVTRTSDEGELVMSLPRNKDAKYQWYITHLSRTELAVMACTYRFFYTDDQEYVFSLADLTDLSDECIVNTVQDQLQAGTERMDHSQC